MWPRLWVSSALSRNFYIPHRGPAESRRCLREDGASVYEGGPNGGSTGPRGSSRATRRVPMTAAEGTRVDWGALRRNGDLARLSFISLGIIFHAGCENMITTIMPSM